MSPTAKATSWLLSLMLGREHFMENFLDNLGKEEIKAFVLDNDLDIEYRKAHKEAFNNETQDPLIDFMRLYGFNAYSTARNINQARYKRVHRCREKIGFAVLSGEAWFLTLTFNNETLLSTTEAKRRTLVSRFLKKVSPFYVGNIDYGDKKKNPKSHEREHYHAIVACYVPPNMALWDKYGFSSCEKIGTDEKDLKRVSKYTAKLSAHALKASTSKGKVTCPRLIYSRTIG